MNEQKNHGGPKVWLTAVVVLSALVGVWNAEDPFAHPPSLDGSVVDPALVLASDQSTNELVANQSVVGEQAHKNSLPMDEILSTLAGAGCPSWMVLAAEGESALTPPEGVVPQKVVQTALQVPTQPVFDPPVLQRQVPATVPRVAYPAPLRVASRGHLKQTSAGGARLQVGAADDADDLLDGMPDLLQDSEQEDKEEATLPTAESVSEPVKASEPEEASKEILVEEIPAVEQKIEVDVKARNQETEPASPLLGNPTPAIEMPAAEEPELKTPEPQEIIMPEPVAEPVQQPIPAVKKQPQPEVLPEPVATPQPQTQRQTQPQVQSKPFVQPQPKATPQQSPFLPPPVPTHLAPHTSASTDASVGGKKKADKKEQSYCDFVAESQFPSAQACAKCHEKHYDEWSVSSHAYAAVSPMFHKFEQRINDLSQATVGYFCYRCHTPVGVSMGFSRATPVWDLPLVAREGVSCIVCHRVNQRYGKVNGHRRIEPGSIHDPVYGPIGGSGVAEVIAQKGKYKVKTSPHETGPGQDIHVAGVKFDQLSRGEFCMPCHQVAVVPGIKLEVVYEQWRASPACKKGISCIDCHMGRLPGVPSGFETGAAAKVGDKSVNSKRRHANHTFHGPGYSIAHPGVFPFNVDANRWSMKTWLKFDWRAGWGTEDFEDALDDGQIVVSFPPEWEEADDRFDARDIIDDNLKKLEAKNISRHQLMENGSHVDGPYFDTQLVRGQDFKFHYVMTNLNEGHNLPSGSLGAQPQLWAHVVLIGPRGQRLWESGYTDSWGDVADIHSVDVRNKVVPFDTQLFNLQTMFLTTGVKGADREFPLPVNYSFDQLPYLRPGAQPTSVINHPPFIRMEGRSLPPLGSREIPYKVPAHLMREPGHYRLSFRLRSRLEPIYFMRFCGATEEMIRSMNEGILNFHQSSVEFVVQ